MRTCWLIERTSMWGAEWFCAGTKRWTKDARSAINFPDRDAAIEIHAALRRLDEPLVYPHTEEGTGDWEYRYDITEHGFMESYEPPNAKLCGERSESERTEG